MVSAYSRYQAWRRWQRYTTSSKLGLERSRPGHPLCGGLESVTFRRAAEEEQVSNGDIGRFREGFKLLQGWLGFASLPVIQMGKLIVKGRTPLLPRPLNGPVEQLQGSLQRASSALLAMLANMDLARYQ